MAIIIIVIIKINKYVILWGEISPLFCHQELDKTFVSHWDLNPQ